MKRKNESENGSTKKDDKQSQKQDGQGIAPSARGRRSSRANEARLTAVQGFQLSIALLEVAERAAGLLRSMRCELWHVYELLPREEMPIARLYEMEATVESVARDLCQHAANKVADRSSDLMDARKGVRL